MRVTRCIPPHQRVSEVPYRGRHAESASRWGHTSGRSDDGRAQAHSAAVHDGAPHRGRHGGRRGRRVARAALAERTASGRVVDTDPPALSLLDVYDDEQPAPVLHGGPQWLLLPSLPDLAPVEDSEEAPPCADTARPAQPVDRQPIEGDPDAARTS